MQDAFGNEIIEFHPRYKKLPPGYTIVQLDSGHYMWVFEDPFGPRVRVPLGRDTEGLMSWDKWWVRRCAFAHFAENDPYTVWKNSLDAKRKAR